MRKNKGISLIVLIITIIVIIILATAILVSVINNNPISEANKARYESDRENMQAVFTNTVASIMSKELGTVNITAGQINTETTGVNETTGEVAYTVNNAMISANESGKIVFDKGRNDVTTYYTGKKLPIYEVGETKWYVDSDGIISLEVAGVKYGDGEIESGSVEEVLEAGLYAEDGTFTTWQTLIDNGDLIVTDGVLKGGELSEDGNSVFNGEGKLVIDESVIEIGKEAFGSPLCYGSSGITEIVLPKNLISIGEGAFAECHNITTIEIPESVASIGNYAFFECSSLLSIKLPEGITSISDSLFYWCENLTSVVIPESVTSIENNAFEGCEGLTTIEIPKSVNNIGDNVFRYCDNLIMIEIPESVTDVGIKLFEGCDNLTSVSVNENNHIYDSRNNCNAIIETSTNTLINGCNNTIIPNTITCIGDYAFYYCGNITSIEIPTSVTSINNSAFRSCKNLSIINIPGSVASIGDYAFSGCSNLSSVNLNNGVTSIGNQAFSYCKNMNTLYIPTSVTNISSEDNIEGPFYGCLDSLKIYCGASSKQSGWGRYWDYYSWNQTLNVTYGITREEYESTYKQ